MAKARKRPTRKKKGDDWRKRPRKPPELKRTAQIGIRLTRAELERVHGAAANANQTLSDFVVQRCLGGR